MTSHRSSGVMGPHMLRASLSSIHHIRCTKWHGTARSSEHRGESVIQHLVGRWIKDTSEDLVVRPGISHRQKTWLSERYLDLVSGSPRYDAASSQTDSSVCSKYQHGSLAGVPGGDDADMGRVPSGSNGCRFAWEPFRFVM